MQVTKHCLMVIAAALAGWSGTIVAQDGDGAQQMRLRESLRERMPGLPAIDAINRSPVAGLWEVRVGAVVFYADESGRYVVHGEMRDLGTQRNLTKDRVDQSTAITFTDLPWRDSLTTRRGTGERRIAVFADANCGYCKALERELAKLGDVTIHTFPVAMLGPDSRKRGSSILCAASPERAWQNWMLRSTMSKASKCDASALSRNEAYARRHLLLLTPTIVFADGSLHEGVLSVEQLMSKMAAAAAAGS